jgi:hypothetical protein
MNIDYDVAIKKYLLDARITTKAKVISALRAKGLAGRKADTLLRLCKLAATVNHHFEEPSDLLTYPQLRHLFFNMLALALDRQLSLRKAARWVRANVWPGKRRVSCYSMKHTCDQWYQRHGSACYLTERDFTRVLEQQGWVVQNGHVHAEVQQ